MSIWTAAANALGLAPRVETEGLASPWASSDHLETLTFAGLFGDVSAIGITRERAMSLDMVALGRRRIAATIGRLPLIETTRDGKPITEPRKLLEQPEEGLPRSSTLTWTVDNLLFYPSAYWIVTERDFAGWPVRVILADRARCGHDQHGQLIAYDGAPVDPRNVIRFDSPDGGLLHVAREDLARAHVLRAAASRAESNPVPALDLHNEGEDLRPDEIEDLLASWEKARARRGVGYSSRSLKVTPLGASTENLLIEGRRALDATLARHMGLPAWAADVAVAGSSLTYTNRESRNQELVDLTLAPYLTAIADRLSMGDVTPSTRRVTWDLDSLVRPSRKERFEVLANAISAGIMTVEEARREEGLDREEPTA